MGLLDASLTCWVATVLRLRAHIPTALREVVARSARHRCGYCLTQELPVMGENVPLFNPRRQIWGEHFAWTTDGTRIMGFTPTGRAPVVGLNLNRPALVRARRVWVRAGWHPPRDGGRPV